VAVSRAVDLHFDPAFGTETRGVIETRDQNDVASVNRSRGIRYEPTRALPFRAVMRAAAIPPEGTFVDLGCGKGRTLVLAVVHGFKDVVGIDYSPALCMIAERNLDRLRARSGRVFASQVAAMDAADYAFGADDRVLFLFNPFDATVLAAVMARLSRSIERHPRRVWIVYHRPEWRSTIEKNTWMEHTGDYTFGGCPFAVYRTR